MVRISSAFTMDPVQVQVAAAQAFHALDTDNNGWKVATRFSAIKPLVGLYPKLFFAYACTYVSGLR